MNVIIPIVIAVPLVVFWLWMFWDFINNESVGGNDRLIWTLGFVFAGVVTAVYYFATQYQCR